MVCEPLFALLSHLEILGAELGTSFGLSHILDLLN